MYIDSLDGNVEHLRNLFISQTFDLGEYKHLLAFGGKGLNSPIDTTHLLLTNDGAVGRLEGGQIDVLNIFY